MTETLYLFVPIINPLGIVSLLLVKSFWREDGQVKEIREFSGHHKWLVEVEYRFLKEALCSNSHLA